MQDFSDMQTRPGHDKTAPMQEPIIYSEPEHLEREANDRLESYFRDQAQLEARLTSLNLMIQAEQSRLHVFLSARENQGMGE